MKDDGNVEIDSGSKPDVWRARMDLMGAVASSVCMVHCLVLPALLVVGSMSPIMFLNEEMFHLALVSITIPISSFAFFPGCRRHRDHLMLVLGALGLALLVTGVILPDVVFGEWGERTATVAGGLALVAAHVQNHRRCRPACHN